MDVWQIKLCLRILYLIRDSCSLVTRSHYLLSLPQPGQLLSPSRGKAFSRLLEEVSQGLSVFVLVCCDKKLVAISYFEWARNYSITWL
jgi:hypothetical protein